jgi:molybdopterin-guanine dinucleotide biosynthesis protein MobB
VKPTVIAIVGDKKVGKTTTTENLISQLTQRGYKVAAVKHVSEQDFSIDTPGKDTWRFAQHGAKTILVVSPNEVATIEKGSTENRPLKALLAKCRSNDVVFIEGLKKTVAKKRNIPKIVVVTSEEEAANALQLYKPILAFSGPYNTEKAGFAIPYADALKNPAKLADIIENKLKK